MFLYEVNTQYFYFITVWNKEARRNKPPKHIRVKNQF